MTPAGIEPATFRFVAQRLSHCATAVPVDGKSKRNSTVHPLTQERRSPSDDLEFVEDFRQYENKSYGFTGMTFGHFDYHILWNYSKVHWALRVRKFDFGGSSTLSSARSRFRVERTLSPVIAFIFFCYKIF